MYACKITVNGHFVFYYEKPPHTVLMEPVAQEVTGGYSTMRCLFLMSSLLSVALCAISFRIVWRHGRHTPIIR